MAICARCGQHTESETDACTECGGYALGTRAYAASAAAAAPPTRAATGLRYEQSTNDPDPDEFWYEQYRQADAGPFQWPRGPEPGNGRQHFVPEQRRRTGAESAVASWAGEPSEWQTAAPQWQSDPWGSGQPPEFPPTDDGWRSQPPGFSNADSEWRGQQESDARSSGGSALGSLPAVHTPFAAAPSPAATPAGYAVPAYDLPAYDLPAYEEPGAGSDAAGDSTRYRDPASTSAPRGYEMPEELLDQPGPAAVQPARNDVLSSAGESAFGAAAGSLGTLPSQAAPSQAAPSQAVPPRAVPPRARPSYAADVSEPSLASSPAYADETQLTEPPRTDWSTDPPGTDWPRTDRSVTGRLSMGRSGTGWPGADAVSTARADAVSTARAGADSLPGSRTLPGSGPRDTGPLRDTGPRPGHAADDFSAALTGTPAPVARGGADISADPEVAAAAALAALGWMGEGNRARGRGGVAGRDGNGRWIALAAAFIVLVIAAATAVLVLGRHQNPPHGTAASGSRAAASHSAGPAAVHDGLVTVAPAAVRATHEKAVAAFLNRYFAAINAHDYAAYRRLFSAAVRSGLSPAAFSSGYGSTSDSAVTLTAISEKSHGRVRADVTFTSHQRAASSPDHAACTTWSISLFLTRQGDHFELATPPRDYSPAFRDCA